MKSRSLFHRAIRHKSMAGGIELFSYHSTEQFPRHSHDELGVGVVRKGTHRSWSGIGPVEAEPGDVIMVNPGEIHDGASKGAHPRMWQMIYFHPSAVMTEFEGERDEFPEILRPVARDPQLAGSFDALFSALTHPLAGALIREEKLIFLLANLLRRHTARKLSKSATPRVAVARESMDDAPERNVTLAELAKLCGLSKFQFLRAFQAEFGVTPHAYLLQKRVQTARSLLSRGVPVSYAAAWAGFADQSHLTRRFKRQYAMPPGRYAAALRS